MTAFVRFRERNVLHAELSGRIENMERHFHLVCGSSECEVRDGLNSRDNCGLLFRRIPTVFVAEVRIVNDESDCWFHFFLPLGFGFVTRLFGDGIKLPMFGARNSDVETAIGFGA